MTALTPELEIGAWRVEPDRARICRGATERSLQPLSMDILLYLSSRPGQLVLTDELIERFWPGRCTGSEAVHRRIADLRRQLEDRARHPEYIETIPKRGYRLIAAVRGIGEPAWSLLAEPPVVTSPTSPTLNIELKVTGDGRQLLERLLALLDSGSSLKRQ
ncbi:MAG: winged helix-turn-helix domain-containing protein [Pseudomonadota bacterium]